MDGKMEKGAKKIGKEKHRHLRKIDRALACTACPCPVATQNIIYYMLYQDKNETKTFL